MNTSRVLLADDDLFLRELYVEELKSINVAVVAVSNGEEALAKMKEGNWDLVLIDILMPKMTGFEVVEAIQKEPQKNLYKHLVFLTNLDDHLELEKAKKMGDGYLIKSRLNPDEFTQEVRKYLSS